MPESVTQRIVGNRNVQIAHVQNSTITVSFAAQRNRAVPLEPAWLELPLGVTSPARLLRARYGVVPYVPPGDLGDRLASWCHSGQPFGLRVLAGAAGAGKTRTAIELCRSAAGMKWLAGLLKVKIDAEQLDLLAHTPTARLVVVDYAETRQEQLAEALPILAQNATEEHPVRILLTIRSRTASEDAVRRVLYGRGDALDLAIDDAEVDLLSELPFGEVERIELFTAAVEAIARRLGRDAEPAPVVADQPLTTALMVLVTAYLAVTDGVVPTTQAELLDGLLDHEDRYWAEAAGAAEISAGRTLRRRVVALATLAGAGANESETAAAELLRLIPDLSEASEERRRELARWVRDLYPGTAWWNPVEPDLVGEHLVATTYGDQAAVLAGVLTSRPPDALVQPLRLLSRAARDDNRLRATLHDVVCGRIGELCRTAVEQASGTDAARLLRAGTTVAAALESLVSVAPPDPRRLPDVLNNFPRSNTLLGNLVLTLTSQLTDHYRRLAAANPAAFEPDLARSLNHLGIRLSNLGRREPALQATEEAVEIRRRLAAANPAAFEPDLARALWAYASVCAAGDIQLPEALTAGRGAADIYARLAVQLPAAFTGDLHGVLRTLADVLQRLERHDEADQIRRSLEVGE